MMEAFLGRGEAPLSGEQWEILEQAVVETAKRALVGRRFLPLYGPLGPGAQTVPLDQFEGTFRGVVDMTGEAECGTVKTARIRHLPLPILHKDFALHWRTLAASREGLPLDVSAAQAAAAFAARAEDHLIFHGEESLEIEGLLNAEGRGMLPIGDWSQVGSAFNDVTAAIQHLVEEGFYGPYALIVPPVLYARMHGVHERTGVLEIRNVEELTTAGVFRSSEIPDDRALLVSTGPQNLDLAVAQDMTVAYLGPEKMNHLFRVFEILVPRIKRPQAIVTLEPC